MTTFLATVALLGGLAALETLMHGMAALSADFLLLLVFACVAAPHTLNLGHNARISTLQPFLLCAIVLFGVKEAMLLAAVSMVYFWIVGRPRLQAHKGLFNVCNFVLSAWLGGHVLPAFAGRILVVDTAVAQRSARLHVPDPRPLRDGLIAATALVHGVTVVTRNVADFAPTGVPTLNPWTAP